MTCKDASNPKEGKTIANAKAHRAKARTAKSRGLTAACKGDDAFALGEQDLQVEGAVHTIQRNATKVMCKTCGTVKKSHHFHVTDPDGSCRQCATSWSPKDIEYEGVRLKTTLRRSTTRIFGIQQSMWLDSSAQRRKVIDGVIEVASYLRKNEDLRIDHPRRCKTSSVGRRALDCQSRGRRFDSGKKSKNRELKST